MPKLRVGIPRHVEYQPLAWGFLKGHHGDLFTTSQHSVPVLTNLLKADRLDVALLPSTALLRLEDVELLPDLCLSARGRAGIASLVYRPSLAEVTEVAVDPGSEASLDLLALLMAARNQPMPPLRPFRKALEILQGGRLPRNPRPPEAVLELEPTKSALLTGPAALEGDGSPRGPGLEELDLVEGWESATQTPWVEALWAVRRSVSFPDLTFYFKSSLRFGLAALDTLARESAAALGLSAEGLQGRFRENFSYVLRDAERQSLRELEARAVSSQVIPGAVLPPFRS